MASRCPNPPASNHSDRLSHDRPRSDGRSRRHAGIHRERALHGVRLAPDLHDLLSQQRVPGDHGAEAAVPARPVGVPDPDVRSRKGDLIPLSAITRLEKTVGPLAVNHVGQLPAVTISFNLPPGVSLGEAVAEITKVARETLPATIQTTFQGTAQAFEDSQKGLGLLLLVTILVIYMVLGILYEDFLHPLTILSALPFAGFGALLTLLIFKVELSIYAFVGVILLVGLVKKNGIMMVDFAVGGRRSGKSAEEAIYEA